MTRSPTFSEIALDAAVLGRYVGVYQVDENTQRLVTIRDGALHTQRAGGSWSKAYPTSETHFFYKTSLSHFEFVVEDGQVTAMRMYQGGSHEAEEAAKVAGEVPTRQAIALDPAVLQRYVGVYELQPGFELTVYLEGDRLMTQATGQSSIQIHPESGDRVLRRGDRCPDHIRPRTRRDGHSLDPASRWPGHEGPAKGLIGRRAVAREFRVKRGSVRIPVTA